MRNKINDTEIFFSKSHYEQARDNDFDIDGKQKSTMIKIKRIEIIYSILNISAITLISVVLILIQCGYINQFKSGFYCNDPDISFKYNGDTVTPAILMSGVYLIPLITMIICEYINSRIDEKLRFTKQTKRIGSVLWRFYGSYNIVLFINYILISIIKFVYGKPRPHFLDSCRPDSAINCTEGYIYEYECTNKEYSYHVVIDSYRSFLSGHASLSVYAGLFTFWYIEKRTRKWCPKFVSITVQMLVLSFSIISSLTRITDHRHHWWDVLAGTGLGIFLTIYAVMRYCNNFKYKYTSTEKKWTIEETNNFRRKDTEACYTNSVAIINL